MTFRLAASLVALLLASPALAVPQGTPNANGVGALAIANALSELAAAGSQAAARANLGLAGIVPVGGGSSLGLGTTTGTAITLKSLTGSGSPWEFTPGKAGAAAANLNTASVGQNYQVDGATKWSVNGADLAATVPVGYAAYTVATLPSCTASIKGHAAYVTDQSGTPSYGGALTGGGSTPWPTFCTGTAWTAH